jgi:hypothetical protein
MRRFTTYLLSLALLLTACVNPPEDEPTATSESTQTIGLPPEWTSIATSPAETKISSPTAATPTTPTPSPTSVQIHEPISLLCPPAGNLIEIGRSETTFGAIDVTIAGDYAYLLDHTGLRTFNIDNPEQPVEVAYKSISASHQIAIMDGHLFGINDEGLLKLELSDPADPTFLAYKDTPDSPMELSLANDFIFIRDNYGNLRTFDPAPGANLQEVGVYDPPGENLTSVTHGDMISTVRELGLENPFHSFAILDDYAYVADLDAELRIVNISDPTRLLELGSSELLAIITDVEVIETVALIFGVRQGSQTDAWGVWGQKVPDLLLGRRPIYLGEMPILEGTKPEVICTFISEIYGLISESKFNSDFSEIPPEEIIDILKGVAVMGDIIYVADGKRGLVVLKLEPLQE